METAKQIAEAAPLFKKRNLKKSTIRKRPATPPSDSESGSEYSAAEEDGRKLKRRRKTGGVVIASSKQSSKSNKLDLSADQFAADRSTQIDVSSDATRQSNWYDQENNALDEKSLLGTTRKWSQEDEYEGEENYRGTTTYKSFINKNPNAPTKQIGPVKAPTNIRTITVTDFAPDVCKDYKQTGYCGFGDNCKYLHAREDYKQGWQLDKDWETVTKGKNVGGKVVSRRDKSQGADLDSEEEEDVMLEGIPFACIICKGPYKYPIVTKCGHYFCEACAIQRFKKTPSCAACSAGTGGVFNGAKNLKKLLEKKRERAAKRREKAREIGEDISEEDGDVAEEAE